jgi:hypothetical protein
VSIDSQTIIAKQKQDDQIQMFSREILKKLTSKKQLELDEKSIDLPQFFKNSIQTFINDESENPSNQYEMRRDDFKKFATLSRVNAKYNYS